MDSLSNIVKQLLVSKTEPKASSKFEGRIFGIHGASGKDCGIHVVRLSPLRRFLLVDFPSVLSL